MTRPPLRRIALAAAFAGGSADARTFRVAPGEAVSMDPHSFNESLELSFTGSIYVAATSS